MNKTIKNFAVTREMLTVLLVSSLLLAFVISVFYLIIWYENYEFKRGFESTAPNHPNKEISIDAIFNRDLIAISEKDG